MTLPFTWDFPYGWPRKPLLARNVCATSQPLAAQAGARMLAAGGSAVDAALACAIALTVVEPVSNGVGSDAYAIVWDGTRLHGLNASGRSPAAWTPELFGAQGVPLRGWNSVTVPGCVSAWVALWERFGRLPFAKLFEPAIAYARDGWLVSPTVAAQWAAQVPELAAQPGFAQAFMPGGRAPAAGELFRLPELARTLELIAETRGEAFYRGRIAEAIEADAHRHGALLRASDLAEHRAEWVEPLALDYRGYTVHELPPNGQGVVALEALGILREHALARFAPDAADAVHLQIEAVKLAFADALAYLADPASMPFRAERLLEADYLRERARRLDPARAGTPAPGRPIGGGTVYLAAADAAGMMVSMIQSNYMGFGSGVVVAGTGISLQNRGACFVSSEGHPNRVGPRKRPYQTIIPGFLTKEGAPVMSFGVMGGTMQPQGHVQVLVRIIDWAQNPQAACDAPRFRWVAGRRVACEPGFPSATLEALAARGHEMADLGGDYNQFGSAQMIWRLGDGYLAASDPRRDGQAVGF